MRVDALQRHQPFATLNTSSSSSSSRRGGAAWGGDGGTEAQQQQRVALYMHLSSKSSMYGAAASPSQGAARPATRSAAAAAAALAAAAAAAAACALAQLAPSKGSSSKAPVAAGAASAAAAVAAEFVSPFEVALPRAAAAAADVQCSSSEVFVLDLEGRVFVVDDVPLLLQQHHQEQQQQQQQQQQEQQTFRQLTGLPVKGLLKSDFISSMSIGAEHAAFVSNDGRLCQCAAAAAAAAMLLLLLLLQVEAPVLLLVVLPEGAKAAAAACGMRHTLVLSSAGETFAFGDDSKIQLGIGDTRAQGGADIGTTYKQRIDMADIKAPMRRGATYALLERHIQHEPMKTLKPPAAISPEGQERVGLLETHFSAAVKLRGDSAGGRCSSSSKRCCPYRSAAVAAAAAAAAAAEELNCRPLCLPPECPLSSLLSPAAPLTALPLSIVKASLAGASTAKARWELDLEALSPQLGDFSSAEGLKETPAGKAPEKETAKSAFSQRADTEPAAAAAAAGGGGGSSQQDKGEIMLVRLRSIPSFAYFARSHAIIKHERRGPAQWLRSLLVYVHLRRQQRAFSTWMTAETQLGNEAAATAKEVQRQKPKP
ncbi:hypothetical protein Emag_001216 [Eimeria magna]